MPQFIICDEAKITQQDLTVLRDASAQGVHIVRNKQKAWNNHIAMQEILRKLHAAASHREDLQLVLVLDVAPCHIHKDVMQKAKALGIWLVFVPSKITSLVQPLDTHGFAGFKAWLCKQYALLRSKSHGGLVSRLDWLRVLQSAKAQFFDSRQWAKSFSDTGARVPFARLTRALAKHVEPSMARDAASSMLDTTDLAYFWPKRRRMLYAHPLLFPSSCRVRKEQPQASVATSKRPAPEPAISIALASRSLKRACRQYPCRSDV